MFEFSRRCKQIHVKMITSLARDKHKRLVMVALISMIVVCGQVAGSRRLTTARFGDDQDDAEQWEERDEQQSRATLGTAVVDNDAAGQVGGGGPRRQSTLTAPTVDAQDLLLVLAVREFCARHPADCDQSDQLNTRDQSINAKPNGGQQSRKRRHEPTGSSLYTTKTMTTPSRVPNGILVSLAAPAEERARGAVRNSTGGRGKIRGGGGGGGGDELDREGSWTLSNDRVRYATTAAAVSVTSPPPTTGRHRVTTRSWRRLGLRTGPNTYRVSLEEARRFVREQQMGQASFEMGTMAPALLYAARPKVDADETEQQVAAPLSIKMFPEPPPQDELIIRPQMVSSDGGGGGGGGGEPPVTRGRAPVSIRAQRSEQSLAVPKRTELSPENPFAADSSATTTKTTTATSSSTTTTSGHQLVQESSGTSSSGSTSTNDTTQDVMQCNLRSYTYRATKTDGRGNTCTGLITASICYGGCDSGEIADWLFPYKKPIHKVCRHGGRVRRRVLLSECHSLSGLMIEDGLREYHYVDARDCTCKKCTGSDTNCLGTMTQPHLQTLGETVAELTAATSGD